MYFVFSSIFLYVVNLITRTLGLIFIKVNKKSIDITYKGIIALCGGIILSFASFLVLPIVFLIDGLYYGTVFILCGILFSIFVEEKVNKKFKSVKDLNFNFFMGLSCGIIFVLYPVDFFKILTFMSLYVLLKNIIHNKSENIFIDSFMSISNIIIGMFIGIMVTDISMGFSSMLLGFVGGNILYMASGYVSPNIEENIKSKILMYLSATLGIILGIFIIYF